MRHARRWRSCSAPDHRCESDDQRSVTTAERVGADDQRAGADAIALIEAPNVRSTPTIARLEPTTALIDPTNVLIEPTNALNTTTNGLCAAPETGVGACGQRTPFRGVWSGWYGAVCASDWRSWWLAGWVVVLAALPLMAVG